MAALVLLRLSALTGEGAYRSSAEAALAQVAAPAQRYPTSFAQWLSAVAFAVGDTIEIALIGDASSPDLRALLDVVRRGIPPAWRSWPPARPAAAPFRCSRSAVARRPCHGLRVPQLCLPGTGRRTARSGGSTSIDTMISRLLAAVSLACLATLAIAVPVLGHAELVESDPPDGGTIQTDGGYTFTATFSEEMLEGSGVVRSQLGRRGGRQRRGSIRTMPTVLTAELPELEPGDYAARWTAITDDGHTERGTIKFSVEAATPTPPRRRTAPTEPPTEAPSATASAAPTASEAPSATAAPRRRLRSDARPDRPTRRRATTTSSSPWRWPRSRSAAWLRSSSCAAGTDQTR